MPVLERSNPNKLYDILVHPFVAKCDREGCALQRASQSFEIAEWYLDNHPCPLPYNLQERIVELAQGQTLLGALWGQMDTWMIALMGMAPDDPDRQRMVGRLQGAATAVEIWMTPIFQSRDDVSREVKRRYEASKRGERHQTAGVDYRWTPPDAPGKPAKPPAPRREIVEAHASPAPSASPKPTLPPDKLAQAKKMLAAGMAKGSVAQMLGVTVGQLAGVGA